MSYAQVKLRLAIVWIFNEARCSGLSFQKFFFRPTAR